MNKEDIILDNSNPYEIGSSGNDNLKKFSDILLSKYLGKYLEIYAGDQSETINFEEYSIPQNCCIFGKLVDVLDRFLVLECFYVSKKGQLQSDGIYFINTFQIRCLTEVNDKGSLNDIFLHVKDAEKIRKLILAHK